MNLDHYAIVIGLSQYLALGEPPPANLRGPENDAKAIHAWLIDPAGGALPEKNVLCKVSSDWNAPPKAAPRRDDLAELFLWLEDLAEKNDAAGLGLRVGERIYIYVAGHGASTDSMKACLLTGDASSKRVDTNISLSSWIEWLQEAAYFREFVLWMDCCMDRNVPLIPQPAPLVALRSGTPPAASMITFAARRPLGTVEKPIPEDNARYHGVFTWNLLQGLRGAARDSAGNVSARSLSVWLCQAQLSWLDDSERASASLSKEPEIVKSDELILNRAVPPCPLAITLKFPPAAVGHSARLWSGAPAQAGPWFVVGEDPVVVQLRPGLYLAECATAGLRHGFSVTRSVEVALKDAGSPVQPGTGPFQLIVDPRDKAAQIRLASAGFDFVDKATGRLQTRQIFGLYQIRTHVARQIVERVILLDGDRDMAPADPLAPVAAPSGDVLPTSPLITSAAPLSNTRSTREFHRGAVVSAGARVDVKKGTGAQLMVMVRSLNGDDAAPATAHPWRGVAVLDSTGAVIADLEAVGVREAGDAANPPEPAAVCVLEVSPGAYTLRYPMTDGNVVAQSLIIPPGNWRMEAYILQMAERDRVESRPRVSLLMRRIGAPWNTELDLLLEKARVAVADGRSLLNDEITELLVRKFESPTAGILGGHQLLIEHESSAPPQNDLLGLLATVVTNLRALVGTNHPDVEALSLACSESTMHTTQPIGAPPMFERSWKLLIDASQSTPTLVPLAVWQKVSVLLPAPPFLTWYTDAAARSRFIKALADLAFAPRPSAPAQREPASATADAVTSDSSPIFGSPDPGSITTQGLRSPSPSVSILAAPKSVFKGIGGRLSGTVDILLRAADLWTAKDKKQKKRPEAAASKQSIPAHELSRQEAVELGLPPAALEMLREARRKDGDIQR
jgi:hypothetical protein